MSALGGNQTFADGQTIGTALGFCHAKSPANQLVSALGQKPPLGG